MDAASLVQLVGEGLRRAPGLQVWEVAAGIALGALFFGGVARWVRGRESFDPLGLRATAGAMLFLVVSDLLPDALEEIDPSRAAAAFTAGAIGMIVLGRLVGL